MYVLSHLMSSYKFWRHKLNLWLIIFTSIHIKSLYTHAPQISFKNFKVEFPRKPLVNVIFLAKLTWNFGGSIIFIFFFISLSVSPLNFWTACSKVRLFPIEKRHLKLLVTRRKRHPNKKKPRTWGTKLTKRVPQTCYHHSFLHVNHRTKS